MNDAKVASRVDALDDNKMSALHYAARYGHLDVVRQLVEKGADTSIKGFDGLTPLHLCAKYKTQDNRHYLRMF